MKFCAFFLLFIPVMLVAQRQQQSTKDDSNVLELPEFIIKGSGTLNTEAVRKEDPRGGWGLDSAHLAALHPVAGAPLPAQTGDTLRAESAAAAHDLTLHAQFGMYGTPDAWIRFHTLFAPFDIYARGSDFATNGSVANAAAQGYAVAAGAGWRVPENVMYFADARAGVDVALHSTAYNLYGSPAPLLQRTTRNGGMGIGVDQNGGTVQFNIHFLSAGFSAEDVTSNSENLFGVRGGMSLIGMQWMASAAVRFYTYTTASSSRNFSEAHFEARRLAGNLRYAIGGSLFSAQNAIYNAQTFLAPLAEAKFALSPSWDIFARFAPAMRNETMAAILEANPYIQLSSLDSIRYPYEPVNIAAGVQTAGSGAFDGEAAVSFIRSNDDRIFRLLDSNRWSLDYDNTATVELRAQGGWHITPSDDASGMIAMRSSVVVSNGEPVPYVPAFTAQAGYSHNFATPLTVGADVDIFGARTSDLSGGGALPGAVLVNAHAEYTLFKHLALTAEAKNIFDQSYMVWNGYTATKFFGAVGVTTAF